MLLGVGAGDAANAAFSAAKCGVKGDFETICTPMAMVPYRAGVWYFHGGASLQEAVVPVISVKGGSNAAQEAAATEWAIRISITGRFPVSKSGNTIS